MATIYDTTMSPTKLELLSAWLPGQDWYDGPATPELRRAGGFRLDDPAGEVGIEFMVVNAVGVTSVIYHVPMTYRGEALPSADAALIGTSAHGVLGKRWIYDGAADPVLLEQLTQLLLGKVSAQHQSRSDEVDERVVVRTTTDVDVAAAARILRVLAVGETDATPSVTVPWKAPDGSKVTGTVVAP